MNKSITTGGRVISHIATVSLLFVMLLGCTHVQPWEKQTLAKLTMKPGGPVPELGVFDNHVYYSKEALQGGSGVGGGGCGCN